MRLLDPDAYWSGVSMRAIMLLQKYDMELKDWDEGSHPRDESGRFGSGGLSSSGGIKGKVKEFINGSGKEAINTVAGKLKEHHKELLAGAVTFSLYHIVGADFPVNVEQAIHGEIANLATNLQVSVGVARSYMSKVVDELIALRSKSSDEILDALLKLKDILDKDKTKGTGDWDESEHPRDEHGQFSGGGGGGGAGLSGGGVELGAKPVDMNQATKVGPQKGSNPGGVYKIDGKEYYAKQGKSVAHVRNELMAVDLARAAGVKTLNYVPSVGDTHVVSKMEKLTKDNYQVLTPEEKAKVQETFVAQAWLANWDAAGLVYDNQAVIPGKGVVTLDFGGALEYRAQGAPKGAAFGDKVDELNTMRNPAINKQNAVVFGNMTAEQMIISASKVLKISDEEIFNIVQAHGGSPKLALKLVDRKYDIAAWAKNLSTAEGAMAPAPTGIGAPTPSTPDAAPGYVDTPAKVAVADLASQMASVGPSTIEAGVVKLEGSILHHNGQKLETHPQKQKGTTAERVALRAAAKAATGNQKATIQKVVDAAQLASFLKQHNALMKKGDSSSMKKAGELESHIKKLGGTVGQSITSIDSPVTKAMAAGTPVPAVQPAVKPAAVVAPPAKPAAVAPPPAVNPVEQARQYLQAILGKSVTDDQVANYIDLKGLVGNNTSASDLVKTATYDLEKSPVENIDPVQLAHIKAYTGSYFGPTNKQLRDGLMTEEIWSHALRLNEALDKLPDYKGIVGRGVYVPNVAEFMKGYQVGMIKEERAFTSAAKGKGFGGKVKYQIQSKTGKDVSTYSQHSGEKEVLFKSGTRFRVVKIEQDYDVNIIHMEEVSTAIYIKHRYYTDLMWKMNMAEKQKPKYKYPTTTNKYGESDVIGVLPDGTLNLIAHEDDFPEEYADSDPKRLREESKLDADK
jgi:hypothetical protein